MKQDQPSMITGKNLILDLGDKTYAGRRFCCSHSKQAALDLAMNLTLPRRSITSQC